MTDSNRTTRIDVAIIGGGAAGLSGALALGRSRRSVVVVDAGRPRNAPSAHMHGYLGLDGMSPTAFLEAGRADVAKYGVTIVPATATAATRRGDGRFDVLLDDGSTLIARRLLVASGLTDELPDVAGLHERWGRDVLHCPYCHGWEVRGQAITIISTGPMGAHAALLFRQLTDDVTLVLHAGPAPTVEDTAKLAARGVRVVDDRATEVIVTDDRITGLRMLAGDELATDALVVAPRLIAHSPVLASLGLEPVAHPMGPEIGRSYEASPTGQTTVPGVWVAGNVTDLMGTVPAVTAAGYMAGAVINADLVTEEADAAVAGVEWPTAHGPGGHHHGGDGGDEVDEHQHDMAVMDEAFWDARYGTADRIWSGNPNPHVVTDTADLTPGRVLDIGAGEGADAIWLAQRGWTVTAVDISSVALERGRTAAASMGSEVAERIDWVHTDVLADDLPDGPFDLVSLQFMHFASAMRTPLFQRSMGAVAPGGTLLVVAHHPSDMMTTAGRPRVPDFFYTADELAALVDDEWTIVAQDARPRSFTDDNGDEGTIHDTVFVARRN